MHPNHWVVCIGMTDAAEQRDEQTIELDCPPGFPRPGDLIEGVIKDTGLPLREPVLKFFGEWTWDYTDIDAAKWDAIRPILKERIGKLYYAGVIRYGSY